MKLYIITILTVIVMNGCSFNNTLQKKEQNSILTISQAKIHYAYFPWHSFIRMANKIWTAKELEQANIELLKGGYSSDSLFKINVSSKNYVIRFMNIKRSLNDRLTITKSFEWASKYDIGPKVYIVDPEGLFIVMDFVEGRTLILQDTHNKDIIKTLGITLAKLHKVEGKDLREMSQFTIGQSWYKNTLLTPNKIHGPSILKEAYVYWNQINEEIKKFPAKKAMLHNDPNLNNILWHNGKILLLDWELSGAEEPRKELAHVIAWMELNKKLANIFLTAYYGRKPTKSELFVIGKMKQMILLEFAWVGLSSLNLTNQLNQKQWDELYEKVQPQTVEKLSIIQATSVDKPSDEYLRNIYLGLIKQFIRSCNNVKYFKLH